MAASRGAGVWRARRTGANLMPPVLAALPLIIGLVGAGTGAAELGLKLSGADNPATPSPYPTASQTASNTAQLASVVRQGMPNVQEAGGGGLSPNYAASVIGSDSGTLNQTNALQDIIKQLTGGAGGGGAGGSTDALTQLINGNNGGTGTNFPQLSIPSQGTTSLSGGPGLVDSNVFGGQSA